MGMRPGLQGYQLSAQARLLACRCGAWAACLGSMADRALFCPHELTDGVLRCWLAHSLSQGPVGPFVPGCFSLFHTPAAGFLEKLDVRGLT